MKARNGQVALYLIAVLVAIAIMIFMNVDIFLAIRAKNHATNAGDAAAIAVAGYQGTLLNQVGEDNINLLISALTNGWDDCRSIMCRQRRRVFLGPLEGLRIGSLAARDAISRSETGYGDLAERFETSKMRKILEQHVFDIRNVYSSSPELYPEPWDCAWEEYARIIEMTIAGDFIAGPENVEFASAYKCFPLLDQEFYNAVAGEMWCWFMWRDAEWLFDRDHFSMPRPVFTSDEKRDNSEIYSLHLDIRPLPVLTERWTNIIMRLTGCTEDAIKGSSLLASGLLEFAFYDDLHWISWKESGFSVVNGFPLVGDVKDEYDVLGAAAICRVKRTGAGYAADAQDGENQISYPWTAAAKPFGTVENLDGHLDVVTCLERFVVPAFTDVRLVPIDSVGGKDLHTADYDWMQHVRQHIPAYLEHGLFHKGCWYCDQLKRWENPVFREAGRRWLIYYSSDCDRPLPGTEHAHGGTVHAH